MKRAVLIAILAILPTLVWANGTSVGFSSVADNADVSTRRENRAADGALFASTLSRRTNGIGTYNSTGYVGGGHSQASRAATLGSSASMTGASLQVTFDVPKGKPSANGAGLNGGTTTVTVPEPGTLGLLGTGLLGIAGLIRRKLKSNPPRS